MSSKYKICPQMLFYDKLQNNYAKHLMFIQEANFRSEVCNTDSYGLRFNSNKLLHIKKTIFDEYNESDKSKQQAIIIGGSQVFGIGSSSDSHTISSCLNRDTNFYFYNFGGRAFNGLQEILNFLLQINNLKKISRIIILSGLNDLFMFENKNFTKKFPGPMYYDNLYVNALKDLNSSIIDKIKNLFLKKNIQNNYSEINLKDVLSRNLHILASMSKSMNIKIDFFLSPFIYWSKKTENYSDEEKILIKISEKSFVEKENNEVFLNMINKYQDFKNILEQICNLNKINFYDSNEYLSQNIGNKKDWLFVDTVHLTDLGNNHCAKFISEKL